LTKNPSLPRATLPTLLALRYFPDALGTMSC
jgi:hypothetical protein